MEKQTGLCKDGTYQLGVRRSTGMNQAELWALLSSPEGARLFTGTARALDAESIKLKNVGPDGLETCLTTLKAGSHFRMSWKLPSWSGASILQVRVLPGAGEKAILAIHQEKLSDAGTRSALLAAWTRLADEIAKEERSLFPPVFSV